jgi:hypothetical protein
VHRIGSLEELGELYLTDTDDEEEDTEDLKENPTGSDSDSTHSSLELEKDIKSRKKNRLSKGPLDKQTKTRKKLKRMLITQTVRVQDDLLPVFAKGERQIDALFGNSDINLELGTISVSIVTCENAYQIDA